VPAASLAITAALGLHAWRIRKSRDSTACLIFGLLWVSIVALFFSSELSYPFWRYSATLQMVQFPYRFTYLQMIASVLGGSMCLGRGPRITGRVAFGLPLALTFILLGLALVVNGMLTFLQHMGAAYER
jgi:hypothetical protein